MKDKRHTGLKRLVLPVLFLVLCVPFVLAQEPAKVTGKVIDDTGEPMIGVSVQVKGTSHGAITDIDGNYSVNVEPGATLIFSYVGYLTQEYKAKPGTLNVTLHEDTETLDELVVIGYGVQKKSSVTGAISQVKAEDMPCKVRRQACSLFPLPAARANRPPSACVVIRLMPLPTPCMWWMACA